MGLPVTPELHDLQQPHMQLNNLQWQKEKKGGKNHDDRNGIYIDPNAPSDQSLFVKFPNDLEETINEYLTGQLFQAMLQHDIIPPEDEHLLSATSLVEDPDTNQLGLIQPYLEQTTPLYKLIGTSSLFTDDRSAFLESGPFGSQKYTSTPKRYLLNLQKIVAISLILGDYSVHSGNILLDTHADSAYKIDLGAGLRNLLILGNNDDIDHPIEYQQNPLKLLTKAYHLHYEHIPGFMLGVESIANDIFQTMQHLAITMNDLVTTALEQLPPAWKDHLEKTQLQPIGPSTNSIENTPSLSQQNDVTNETRSPSFDTCSLFSTRTSSTTSRNSTSTASPSSLDSTKSLQQSYGDALTYRLNLVSSRTSIETNQNPSSQTRLTLLSNQIEQMSPAKKASLAFIGLTLIAPVIAATIIVATFYAISCAMHEIRNSISTTQFDNDYTTMAYQR